MMQGDGSALAPREEESRVLFVVWTNSHLGTARVKYAILRSPFISAYPFDTDTTRQAPLTSLITDDTNTRGSHLRTECFHSDNFFC